MGKMKEYVIDQDIKRKQDEQTYMNTFLKDMVFTGNRTRLLQSVQVTCACGKKCKLGSYFNHCNSLYHEEYLKSNNIQCIYTIVDSNVDIPSEILNYKINNVQPNIVVTESSEPKRDEKRVCCCL
jgi:hypothetical protein